MTKTKGKYQKEDALVDCPDGCDDCSYDINKKPNGDPDVNCTKCIAFYKDNSTNAKCDDCITAATK